MQTQCRVCPAPEPHRHIGKWGWIGIFALVVIWDCTAPETLSAVFLRRRTHPAIIFAWSALTAHLFGVLPQRYDPIVRTFRGITVLTERNVHDRPLRPLRPTSTG